MRQKRSYLAGSGGIAHCNVSAVFPVGFCTENGKLVTWAGNTDRDSGGVFRLCPDTVVCVEH